MKKILFTLAMLAATSTSFADEWQSPVYSGSFQSLTPGDTVYIYNCDSKLFLTEGNDWGTHASVGATGLKFIVNTYAEEGAAWDGKTYTISDYSQKKAAWKELFINADGLYVDRASQEDYFFYITDKGNNTYSIAGADLNPTYKSSGEMEGYVVGHFTGYVNTRDGIETGTGVIYDYNGVDNNYGTGEFNATWSFVSQADYAEYLVKANTYAVAMQLQSRINEAELMGVKGIEAEKSIYGNTSSTIDELNNAISSINAKILNYYEVTVTPSNPVDLTYLIKNPTCDDTSGWSNDIEATTWENASMSAGWQTGWEEGAFADSYINIWGATLEGSIYQYLENIPNGIYSFTLSALAEKDGATVFAGDNAKAIPADSKGRKYEIITNVTSGQLDFGIYQSEPATNWLCMDNAQLHYYGKGIDAYKYWLSELKETSPDLSEIIMQTALADEYSDMLNRVDQADTEDKILAIVKDYEELLSRMSLNIVAYEMLADEIAYCEELNTDEDLNEHYGSIISDYIQTEAQPAFEEHTLSTEEVNAIISKLQGNFNEAQNYIWNIRKLDSEVTNAVNIYEDNKNTCPASAIEEYLDFMAQYDALDRAQLTNDAVLTLIDKLYAIEFNLNLKDEPASDDNPIDYTAKIYNPSFEGTEGWTNDGWSTFSNNTWYGFANEEGASSGDGNYLNLWNMSNARGYQQITGLPAGAYTISCGAYADKEGLVLYANEQTLDVEVGQNGNNEYMRIYSLDVVVGEDGTLEFGVKNTNGGEMWAMIDEVHLVYKGTESEILTSVSSVSTALTDNAIYSLTGTRLISPLRSGIYIQNGKKVLVK